MIRSIKYNGRDYLIVNTTLELHRKDSPAKAPVDIRIDITKISEADREKIHKEVNTAFNRRLLMKDTEITATKRPWWKKLFS